MGHYDELMEKHFDEQHRSSDNETKIVSIPEQINLNEYRSFRTILQELEFIPLTKQQRIDMENVLSGFSKMFDACNSQSVPETANIEISDIMGSTPISETEDEEPVFDIRIPPRHFDEQVIQTIEKDYENSSYVCEISLKNSRGEWLDSPALLFYQPKQEGSDYSDYFVLYYNELLGSYMIADGAYGEGHQFAVYSMLDEEEVEEKLGESYQTPFLHFSVFQHDFNQTGEGFAIDGGPLYSRLVKYTDEPVFTYRCVIEDGMVKLELS